MIHFWKSSPLKLDTPHNTVNSNLISNVFIYAWTCTYVCVYMYICIRIHMYISEENSVKMKGWIDAYSRGQWLHEPWRQNTYSVPTMLTVCFFTWANIHMHISLISDVMVGTKKGLFNQQGKDNRCQAWRNKNLHPLNNLLYILLVYWEFSSDKKCNVKGLIFMYAAADATLDNGSRTSLKLHMNSIILYLSTSTESRNSSCTKECKM